MAASCSAPQWLRTTHVGLGCFVFATAIAVVSGASGTGTAAGNPQPNVSPQHAIAMHGQPKLAAGFDHFSYANPDAPRGGSVVLGNEGTFDSLNPLIIKGVAGAGLREFLYQSLLERGRDEAFTLYAGLAEKVEMPPDRSFITFRLNPKARFSDGHKVDAEDILFSWRTLRDHGRPNHRAYYAKVTRAEAISDLAVRFELGDGSDRELPLILGLMPVLPSHKITEESFATTTLEPPVGTGPYVVSDVDPGRSLTYRRDPNWWGNEVNAFRGRFNFDEIKFEYYRDGSALFEAFKSGRIDLRLEESPSQWAEGYDIPALKRGELLKAAFPIGLPAGMTALVLNTRKGPFKNPLVRQALIELFDFAWINRNLYHGLFSRTQSFFARSELSSHGIPASDFERELLHPFGDHVLKAVMDGAYALPTTTGDGRNRKSWRRALQLFNGAGYRLKGGVLRDEKTGQPFRFEMLAASVTQQRLFLAYARDLKRLGVDVSVRIVDSSQYQSRLNTYDYDVIQTSWPASLSPGNEQIFRWSSKMVKRDGSYNFAGVANPAVDAMIDAMLAAVSREDFVAAVRALDRVLLSGHYVIPLFHIEKQWVAYWSRLARPETVPLFGYQFDTWWIGDGNHVN